MSSLVVSTIPDPNPFSASFQRLGAQGIRRSGRRAGTGKNIRWTLTLDQVLLQTREKSRASRQIGYAKRWIDLWEREQPEVKASVNALKARYRRIVGLEKYKPKEGVLRGHSPEANQATNESRQMEGGTECEVQGDGARAVADEHMSIVECKDEVRQDFLKEYRKTRCLKVGDLTQRKKPSIRSIKVHENKLLAVDELISEQYRKKRSLWNLNCLVYAGAIIVAKSAKKFPKQTATNEIKRRAEIRHLRKVVGWVRSDLAKRKEGGSMTPRQRKNREVIVKLCGSGSTRRLRLFLETKSTMLKIKTRQLREVKARQRRKKLNERYRLERTKVLGKRAERGKAAPGPTADQVSEYWGGVLGVEGEYDPDNSAITQWLEECPDCADGDDMELSEEDYAAVLKRAKNWKAAGRDGIAAYWWKAFPQANKRLWKHIRHIIGGRRVPSWLVKGRTVLIPKPGCTGKADQYRPITVLNTAYKLLTGVLTAMLQAHVESFDILPAEQKALRKGRRGCLDALLIDTMITESTKDEQRDLSVAWIDYQKAYDRVPHGWLQMVLRAIKAPENVRDCIRRLSEKWETEFSIGKEKEVRVNMHPQRGLFQGDSLSPLLFCLCILPLSHALRGTGGGFEGYLLEEPISHLLFMDDLKVYATNQEELEGVIELVDEVSEAMGMSLGLRKCAVAHMECGVCVEGSEVILRDERKIQNLRWPDVYKYLGISQLFDPNGKAIREALTTEYLKRIRIVWSSDLSAKHKVDATNTWATAVFPYFFPIMRWYRTNLAAVDAKTRSILRNNKSIYGVSACERIYLPRSEGGRGLNRVRFLWEREVVSSALYLAKTAEIDPHLNAVWQHQLYRNRQDKYTNLGEAKGIAEAYELDIEFDGREEPRKVAARLKERQYQGMRNSVRSKTIHSAYWNQVDKPGMDTRVSHAWLKDGRLMAKTESYVIALQDGVVLTRLYRARILREPISSLCRACGGGPEGVKHVLSCCPQSLWSRYKERHDRVAYQVVRMLCQHFSMGIPAKQGWGSQGMAVPMVIEDSRVKITIDQPIPTLNYIEERRPDLLVTLPEEKRMCIIEVAVAWDELVLERERQKRDKYQPLKADLGRMTGWEVLVIPVVVGCLGSIGGLVQSIMDLKIFSKTEALKLTKEIQMEALVAAVRIAKRHLSMSEGVR